MIRGHKIDQNSAIRLYPLKIISQKNITKKSKTKLTRAIAKHLKRDSQKTFKIIY